jgi:hypothetical protein
LVVAVVLVAAALAALLWADLTYDPSRGAKSVVLTMPLPPPLAAPAERPSESPAPSIEQPPPADGGQGGNTSAPPAAPPPAAEQPPAPPPVTQAAPPAPAPVQRTPDRSGAPSPSPAFPVGPEALAPPEAALSEPSKDGVLPIIGRGGRKPWIAYARPFDATNPRPRIAIVISDLGQSAAATEAAIQTLPGPVTFAFNPYGQRLEYWSARARAAGHEVLVLVPMEPVNYPANDPGPQTLLTTLSAPENRERLNWSLSRFPGYVGVLSLAGSRYTTALESLRATLDQIRGRGLMFVDARSSLRSSAFRLAGEIGLPRALNNRFIDVQASKDEIDRRLDELVKIASTSGFAVGIGQPYPATIERVAAFVRQADSRGLAIAPVSAIADRQKE